MPSEEEGSLKELVLIVKFKELLWSSLTKWMDLILSARYRKALQLQITFVGQSHHGHKSP